MYQYVTMNSNHKISMCNATHMNLYDCLNIITGKTSGGEKKRPICLGSLIINISKSRITYRLAYDANNKSDRIFYTNMELQQTMYYYF